MIRMRPLIVVLMIIVGTAVHAQSDMMIHGVSPNLFLTHTVAAKETWYSLSRMYNLTPKEIAAFNKGSMEKPLSIGQTLQIPLRSANFSQDNSSTSSDVLVPLYHVVQEKEWMYRISVNHNKVPIENLEKWNNISRDQAKAGTRLIVGFLKVKNGLSPAATAPVAKSENATSVDSKLETASKDLPPIPKETPKKESAVTETKALPPSGSSTGSATIPTSDKNFKGGYFKSQYTETGKSSSGVSGIFKSTSGWNDGKYYALMNSVPVGTIVRVNFPSTTKVIYAKVLGQLPDMRESAGLAIRISEAAASELGAANGKFNVEVKY